jgi:hypothetical protein
MSAVMRGIQMSAILHKANILDECRDAIGNNTVTVGDSKVTEYVVSECINAIDAYCAGHILKVEYRGNLEFNEQVLDRILKLVYNSLRERISMRPHVITRELLEAYLTNDIESAAN